MEVLELRIGNWIETPRGIHQVKGIGAKGDEYYASFNDLHEGYYLSTCEPIPLTEDVLMKCGFSMKWGTDPQEPNALKVFTHDKVHLRLLIDERDTRYTTMLGESYRLCPISSLHQLQNLYFALTNEGLEI